MKKIMFISAMALVLAVAGTACQPSGNQAKIDDFVIGEVYKTATMSYKLVGDTTYGKGVSVYNTTSVTMQWPTKFGSNDLTALQDSLMLTVLDTTGIDINKAINLYINKPWWEGGGKAEKVESVPEVSDSVRILERNVKMSSVGFSDTYMVFRIDYYEDFGGAHPNYYSHFLNYDIKNNKILYYKDVFKPGTDAALLDVVKQGLCKKYMANSLSELGEKSGIFIDQINVSREIYLTGDKVVFHYNPYAIGCWAAGTIDLEVPAYELLDYLTDMAKTLFGFPAVPVRK